MRGVPGPLFGPGYNNIPQRTGAVYLRMESRHTGGKVTIRAHLIEGRGSHEVRYGAEGQN